MIGRTLSGRYVVEEVVGTGGMAVVYRAHDTKLNRPVAVKVLRPEFESDTEFVRRFTREAEAASKMKHENTVNMLDVGQEDGHRFIVMEYIDGQTLKNMIVSNGQIRPDVAVRMAIRILAAIDHAHKNSIVHRDIKPQNILVDRQGNVKVADFGIARLKSSQTTKLADGNNSALGSVHYFSPEQASGEVADEKSDLYSVGIVLYEMLTGTVPFDGDTAVSVALKHVSETPRSMREHIPNISKALDEVVIRALAKDKQRRYQTAAEMAADLRKALGRPKGGFVKYPLTKEEQEKQRETELRLTQRRKKALRAAGQISLSLLLLAILGGAVWYILAVHNVKIIPPVVGLHMDEAVQLAQDRGFKPVVIKSYSEEIAEGYVIDQSPDQGERRKGGNRLEINVSSGSQWMLLDDLSGLTLEYAQDLLGEQGVVNVTITYVMSDADISTIVAQEPAEGWITRETAVELRVSGERTTMPPLSGLALDQARDMIAAEGLTIGNIAEAFSADAPAGTVIAQSIAPGAPVLRGAAVDLTVSQSQSQSGAYSAVYLLVVPLEDITVRVEIIAPSGQTSTAYERMLARGTHTASLSSAESGLHLLHVYMDGVLMEESAISFD